LTLGGRLSPTLKLDGWVVLGDGSGDGGACGHVLLLCPTCLQMTHFFLSPPLLTWVSSLFSLEARSLLFFFGLPSKLFFTGGKTSGNGVISQTFWPFTGYIIEL